MTKRVGLLVRSAEGWLHHLALATPGLRWHHLPLAELGTQHINPYQLPDAPAQLDAIYVCTNWYIWLQDNHPDKVDAVFASLRKHARVVAGIESYATFALGLPPAGFDRLDFVIKGQGIYHDRELYNYQAGSFYPDIRQWASKQTPAPVQYSPAQLDKLRRGLPCMLAIHPPVRHRVRKHLPTISTGQRWLRRMGDQAIQSQTRLLQQLHKPAALVQFAGALTHYQRLKMVEEIRKAQLSGDLRLWLTKDKKVFGLHAYQSQRPEHVHPLSDEEVTHLQQQLHDLQVSPQRLGRGEFLKAMLRHYIILAPCGFGELSFRQAEGWQQARAVITQDVSHVDINFPYRPGENILFCRPDFSNLVELCHGYANRPDALLRMGQAGKRSWEAYSANYRQLLINTFNA